MRLRLFGTLMGETKTGRGADRWTSRTKTIWSLFVPEFPSTTAVSTCIEKPVRLRLRLGVGRSSRPWRQPRFSIPGLDYKCCAISLPRHEGNPPDPSGLFTRISPADRFLPPLVFLPHQTSNRLCAVMHEEITVVGGGIIGLASALLLAEEGLKVSLLARDLPGDGGVGWASPYAGAVLLPPPDMGEAELAKLSIAWYQRLAETDPSSGVRVRLSRREV